MPDVEERKYKRDEITRRLEALANTNAESLARTSELSPDINFKEAVPHFKEMLDLCAELSRRDLARLTTEHLDGIKNSCMHLGELIKSVKEFTLNQNTPGDVCQSIISNIASSYDPRWTSQNRPSIDTSKPATTHVASETE